MCMSDISVCECVNTHAMVHVGRAEDTFILSPPLLFMCVPVSNLGDHAFTASNVMGQLHPLLWLLLPSPREVFLEVMSSTSLNPTDVLNSLLAFSSVDDVFFSTSFSTFLPHFLLLKLHCDTRMLHCDITILSCDFIMLQWIITVLQWHHNAPRRHYNVTLWQHSADLWHQNVHCHSLMFYC